MVAAQGSADEAPDISMLHRAADRAEHLAATCGMTEPSGRMTCASSTWTTCSITESYARSRSWPWRIQSEALT